VLRQQAYDAAEANVGGLVITGFCGQEGPRHTSCFGFPDGGIMRYPVPEQQIPDQRSKIGQLI
jgi:hypothetical protein